MKCAILAVSSLICLGATTGLIDAHPSAAMPPVAGGPEEVATTEPESAVAANPDPWPRLRALLDSARRHQEFGRWDEAIEFYRRFEQEAQGITGSQSERAQAAWQLAECYFAKGNYQEALDAIAMAAREPFQHWCGTAVVEHALRHYLRLAVLNEYLARYEAAVESYLGLAEVDRPGAALHLLALYERAGQMPDLLRMVDAHDRRWLERTQALGQDCRAGRSCPHKHSDLHRIVYGMLELREYERRGDWIALVAVLNWKPGDAGRGPRGFAYVEAARLLALHPEESLPYLLPNLRRNWWCAYALALTAAPEALVALKQELTRQENSSDLMELMEVVLAAGTPGVEALNELYPASSGSLRIAIESYRAGTLSTHIARYGVLVRLELGAREFSFPPIPPSIRLPNRCVLGEPSQNSYTCTVQAEIPGAAAVRSPHASHMEAGLR